MGESQVQPESGVSQVLPETQNMEDVQIEDGSSTDSIHEESDGLFDVDIDCDPGMVGQIGLPMDKGKELIRLRIMYNSTNMLGDSLMMNENLMNY